MSDPRNNADDAYAAFMSMSESEWLGLCGSILQGGVLQPAENEGFSRAVIERKRMRSEVINVAVVCRYVGDDDDLLVTVLDHDTGKQIDRKYFRGGSDRTETEADAWVAEHKNWSVVK